MQYFLPPDLSVHYLAHAHHMIGVTRGYFRNKKLSFFKLEYDRIAANDKSQTVD